MPGSHMEGTEKWGAAHGEGQHSETLGSKQRELSSHTLTQEMKWLTFLQVVCVPSSLISITWST